MALARCRGRSCCAPSCPTARAKGESRRTITSRSHLDMTPRRFGDRVRKERPRRLSEHGGAIRRLEEQSRCSEVSHCHSSLERARREGIHPCCADWGASRRRVATSRAPLVARARGAHRHVPHHAGTDRRGTRCPASALVPRARAEQSPPRHRRRGSAPWLRGCARRPCPLDALRACCQRCTWPRETRNARRTASSTCCGSRRGDLGGYARAAAKGSASSDARARTTGDRSGNESLPDDSVFHRARTTGAMPRNAQHGAPALPRAGRPGWGHRRSPPPAPRRPVGAPPRSPPCPRGPPRRCRGARGSCGPDAGQGAPCSSRPVTRPATSERENEAQPAVRLSEGTNGERACG